MRARPSFALYWATLHALCFTTGCPELLEDDFAGAGGSSGLTSGTGGTGGDAGAGSGSCGVGGCGQSVAGGEGEPDSGTSSDARTPVTCGPDAALGPNGDCYAAGTSDKTWSDARQSCQGRGAGWELAIIRDAEANAFVLSITGFEAWIGATDGANEGTWSWVLDDAPFFEEDGAVSGAPYTNWSTDEPNDADGSDCLRILTTGFWADWQCDSVKGYVCQKTAP
jgi:hypothetical protein